MALDPSIPKRMERGTKLQNKHSEARLRTEHKASVTRFVMGDGLEATAPALRKVHVCAYGGMPYADYIYSVTAKIRCFH